MKKMDLGAKALVAAIVGGGKVVREKGKGEDDESFDKNRGKRIKANKRARRKMAEASRRRNRVGK